MKKIAFIASGHFGSTIPLIKEYVNHGYSVDYYILCSKLVRDVEAADIFYEPHSLGVNEIPPVNWPKLNTYFQSHNIKIYCIRTPRPYETHQSLYRLALVYRRLVIKKACKFIDKQGYQWVNIVGRYNVLDIEYYLRYLRTISYVSLHEVCDHQNPAFAKPNRLLSYLFKSRSHIIVFSNKSKKDLCSYDGAIESLVHTIPFGLFTSYRIFQGCLKRTIKEDYILFIGRITPYKGISVFINATRSISDKDLKYVIAGKGNDDSLTQIEEDSRYIIINQYLSNEQFVELVENALLIVCPYLSISQSGIPQSVFVFSKPIIASRIDGFCDIITEGENGLLFKTGDVVELEKQLKFILNSSELYNKLREGAGQFENKHKELSWSNIFSLYETFAKQLLVYEH